MGMENEEITIDLMDLFQVVFKKLHLVLLAGIIAAVSYTHLTLPTKA